jgi:hypothetical protein
MQTHFFIIITADRGAQLTSNLELTVPFVTDQAPANNRLPSLGQRDCGEATPLPEGLAACQRRHHHLGHRATLATPGLPDTDISLAQALYGTPLVLPNSYLSINNKQTMNEFIIQIDKILKNHPMLSTTLLQTGSCRRTYPRS